MPPSSGGRSKRPSNRSLKANWYKVGSGAEAPRGASAEELDTRYGVAKRGARLSDEIGEVAFDGRILGAL